MALQKQNIQLSIVDGLDTKTDDKNVLATKFLELENCVFTKTGSLAKRFGNDILSTNLADGSGTLSSGMGLASFKDELLHFDGSKAHSYVDSSDAWTEKGSAVSVIVNTEPVINNTHEQTNAEYGSLSGIEMYAWEDTRGGVRYSIVDANTKNFILSDLEVSGAAADPKIIKLGVFLLLVYREGTILYYRKLNPATPTVLESAVQISNDLDASGIYDVSIGGERVFFTWANGLGGISARYMTTTLIQSSELLIAGETVDTTMTIVCDCSNNVFIYYFDGSDLKVTVYNYDLNSQVLAPLIIDNSNDITHITAIETEEGTGEQTVLFEIFQAANFNYIKKLTVRPDGSFTAATVFKRSVGLYSKIFSTDNGKYVVTIHPSELQATYFVFSIEGDLIAKIVPQNGGGYKVGPNLTEAYEIADGVYKLAVLKKHSLISENGSLFSLLGLQGATLDFKASNHYANTDLADNLHIVGGILQMYDGRSVVEHGFSLYPEGVTGVSIAGSNLSVGSYQYVAVYAWTDNVGQIHRSAPSVPVTVTIIDDGFKSARITVPMLRVTKKEDAFIEIYGTEANGTVFYKLTSSTSPIYNDPDLDSVQFEDTLTDAQKLDNELLYTTGGVLENIAAPSCNYITTYKTRVFVADEKNVFYSKERSEGFPVEFNDSLQIPVDARGGKIRAIANMDNFVLIFKERAIFLISGEGPNNLGEQNDFRLPQLITTDVGCIDSNSVVETPSGLMFKSSKGIYLLSRSLQVDYIGAPVERYNATEITSATLLADTNQVRFTTENSLTLVYDYYHNRWSTFTNHESLDSGIYRSRYVIIKANGEVWMENQSKFTDGAQAIKIKIVSSWIQASGIQGYQRFYKLMLLGNYYSAHQLRVAIAYDFNPAFTQTVLVDAGAALDPTAYGESSPYGDESPYGGSYSPYQWEINPKIQKCQAFKFKIENFENDVQGESFSLSNMAMIVGVKQGLNKKTDTFSHATNTGGS